MEYQSSSRCFKKLQRKRSSGTHQLYKQTKKHSTKEIGEAKRKVFDDLYPRLGKNNRVIYLIAKVRERKIMDISRIRCIKNNDKSALMHDEEISNI